MRMSAYFLLIVLVTSLVSQVPCLPLSGGAISTRDKAQKGEPEQAAANLESQLKEEALQGDLVEKEDGSGSDEPKGPKVISNLDIRQVNGELPEGKSNRPSFSDEEEEILRTVLITLRDNPGLIKAIMDSENAEMQEEFYKQKERVSDPRGSDFWGSFQRPSPQVIRKPKQIEKKAGPKLQIHSPQQEGRPDSQNKPDTIGPLYLANDPEEYPDDEEKHLEIKPVLLSNAKPVTTGRGNMAESRETSRNPEVPKAIPEISINREGTVNKEKLEAVDERHINDGRNEDDGDDESEEKESDGDESNDDEKVNEEVEDGEGEDDGDYEEYEEYYDDNDEIDGDNEKDKGSESDEEDEISEESDQSIGNNEIGADERDKTSHVNDEHVVLKQESPKTAPNDNEEKELLALSRMEAAEGHKQPEDIEPLM